MNNYIDNFKKRLIYRSQYRGTKEMDTGWIASGLRIISFLAVALVIYMFLSILVK